MGYVAFGDQIMMGKKTISVDGRFGPYNSISAAHEALGENGWGKIIKGMKFGVIEADGNVSTYRWTEDDGTADDYEYVADCWIVAFRGVVSGTAFMTNTPAEGSSTADIYYLESARKFGYLTIGVYALEWANRYRYADVNKTPHSNVLYYNMTTRSLYIYNDGTLVPLQSNDMIQNVSELENDAGYITATDLTALATRVADIEERLGIHQNEVSVYIEYRSGSTSSMGTISGNGTFIQGQTVSVVAVPNSGYEFVGWTDPSTGEIVSLDEVYTFVVDSNVVLAASFSEIPTEELVVTLLGKYSINASVTDSNGIRLATTGAYANANGIVGSMLPGEVTLACSATSYGETVQGWKVNGQDETSPVELTEDSVITPVVNGNLTRVKTKGVWEYVNSNGTYKWAGSVDSVHYRTDFFPVIEDQPVKIYIPNHESETVVVKQAFGNCFGSVSSTVSETTELVTDGNGWATYTPALSGYMSLIMAYASDGDMTVLAESDIKSMQVNYACTTAFSEPTFYYENVLDLGSVNGTLEMSVYYEGYLIVITQDAKRIIVVDTATNTVKGSFSSTGLTTGTHCNSASLLPIKYSESDFYPMILLCNNSNSSGGILYVIRLNGSTPVSFTMSVVCTWSFDGANGTSGYTVDDALYVEAWRNSSNQSQTVLSSQGIYKIPLNLTDLSTYVNTTFDLSDMVLNETAALLTTKVTACQDWSVIRKDNGDDIIVMETFNNEKLPALHMGFEFIKTDGTAEGTKLVGFLPVHRMLTGALNGLSYAGNGLFYVTIIASGKIYIYKFLMTLPEYESETNDD